MGVKSSSFLVAHAVEWSCAPCTWEQAPWNCVKAPKAWAHLAKSIHPGNGHPPSFAGGMVATTPVTTRWRSRPGQKL